MTPLAWIQGLLAAIVSAVATSILSSGVSSSVGSPLNWNQISVIAGSSALVGACLFLKQSPIPEISITSSETVKTTVTTSAGVAVQSTALPTHQIPQPPPPSQPEEKTS